MTVKHIFGALTIAWLSTLTAQSKPITREAAQKRAEVFLQQRKDTRKLTPIVNASRLAPKKKKVNAPWTLEPYYVFDRGTNEGFVIVSGDDQTIDVLGYCDEGSFDYQQMPPNMKDWLDDYADQIARIQAGAPVAAAISTHPAVAPMMKSKWSQGNPYNLSCPYDGSSRSVTGCVATAMAQLLYYNRDKSVTETQATIPAYETWTKKIKVGTVPSGSPIDWENMKDTYNSANDLQKKAVADLMFYCGAAAKMDYTNGSSGAQSWDAYQAFIKYFGYSSSKVKWYDYQSVTSDEEWDRIVYAEMAAGRPVYVSGSNATVGHAFVAHGYDGNKRYYINWGWAGQSDGYYYLTKLTPGDGQGIGGSEDGYNGYKQIFVGIEPDIFGEKAMTFAVSTVKNICLANWDTNGDGKFTYNEAAAVTDIGTVFKGNTTITNFAELYYFTSLTKLSDDAFNGCTKLTSIRLPKGLKQIGDRTFKDCSALKQIDLPTGVTSIGEEAFLGCKVLGNIELPQELTIIPNGAFSGCAALTAMELPVCVERIGTQAFQGCTKLNSFTVNTFHPETITLGENIFAEVNLQNAKLNVLQGTKSYFTATEPWKNFGNIFEMRERSAGNFADLAVGNTYYIYNVGTGRYLTKGEAWAAQAIVGTEPMRFKVNHTASMPDGIYYLTTTDLGGTKYLFRTSTDANVGQGVQAAFVDGSSFTASTYWNIQQLSDKVYTFQIPSNGTNYAEGKFWGVQTDHKSGAATPTYGVYSDVVYDEHPRNCQWQFVLYDADKETLYNEGLTLLNLINLAVNRNVNSTAEQAVYDNLESTADELKAAQRSLRAKLKLIDFAEPAVRELCLSLFDSDRDGELSYAEAEAVTSFGYLFMFQNNTSLKSIDELQYFTNASDLNGNMFAGCTNLESVTLPVGLQHIYYRAFYNCKKLTAITIPEYVLAIGDNCFTNCTTLKEVTVESPDPNTMTLGSNVFSGVSLSECTLYVPIGTKTLYEQADVWKGFGKIVEKRMRTQPAYAAIETDVPGYLVNIGTRRQLTMGEAYGTQSVVARSGRVYLLKRNNSMADGLYYIYDSSTGKVVFRTATDTKVGEGVKACFGDGSLSKSAYWKVASVGENIYTFQLPETDADYNANEYLGTNESHASDVASPTNGIYWDITGVSPRSTWAFIPLTAADAALQDDAVVAELKRMLDLAAKKGVNAVEEQAVYDNLQSTIEQFKDAILSLREKMHLITFADNQAQKIALKWDVDGDDELSYEEAAAVTDIGETFRGSNITEFEELRYFTSLTEIPKYAFRDASKMKSISLPASVTKLDDYVFTGCSELRYVVLLNETEVIPAGTNGMSNKATLFVKKSMLESYQNDANWASKVAGVIEYTGIPVVSARGSRDYGKTTAIITALVTGAPINGTPEFECETVGDAKAVVGEYAIQVKPGSITSRGLICEEGVFTVKQTKARITAQSYTRAVGQPNPEFEVLKYLGFKNGETADDVLLVKPQFSCEATIDSPVGVYEIVVSGAEAQNYYFEYVNGTLTITDATGIETVNNIDQQKRLYDFQGRRVVSPRKGIYLDKNNKKKILVRK